MMVSSDAGTPDCSSELVTTKTSVNGESALEKELALQRTQTEELRRNLKKAALYGKELMEQNSFLSSQIEELRKDQEKQIEKYEQDCHRLRVNCENLQKNQQSIITENECLRMEVQQLQLKVEQLVTKEVETKQAVDILKLRIQKLEAERQQLSSENENLLAERELVKGHLSEVRKAHDKSLTMDVSVDDSETLLALQVECETERTKRMNAEQTLLERGAQVNQLQKANDCLVAELGKMNDTLEEKQREILALENLLEEKKEEILGLQALLDAERLINADPASRGNSLFGEVEDRRQKAELELKTCEEKYSSLKKQYSMLQQQHTMLKTRFAALLSSAASTDNADYIHDLEDRLASAMDQLKAQTEKINQLEVRLQDSRSVVNPDQGAKGQVTYISDRALEALLKQARGDIAKLTDELHNHRLTIVTKDEEIQSLTRDLRNAKHVAEKKTAETVSLQIKTEELELSLKELKGLDIQKKQTPEVGTRERLPLQPIEENGEPKFILKEKCGGTQGQENILILKANLEKRSNQSSAHADLTLSTNHFAESNHMTMNTASHSLVSSHVAGQQKKSVRIDDSATERDVVKQNREKPKVKTSTVEVIRAADEQPGECNQQ